MNAGAPIALEVRRADLGDAGERARLDAFVGDHLGGTLFHRPQWLRGVEQGCRQCAHYLVAERGGALVGALPLTEVRSRLFGNALVSAGFATGGGLIAESDQAERTLAEAGWRLARQRGCASLELRGGARPEGWVERSGTYASFARDLPADADALLASIPKRQRAEVRRAMAFGLEVSIGADRRHRDAHHAVYAESVRNLGTPLFPRALFEAMLDGFGGDGWIVMVWREGRPLAALLGFDHKGAAMPYWGGGTAEAREWRANDLVYYAAMGLAIERGCTRADFGRSKIGSGPWARKRIWGFEETPLTYAARTADGAAPREVNPQSPRYRLQVEAWKRLPLWLANRLGPTIARGLG